MGVKSCRLLIDLRFVCQFLKKNWYRKFSLKSAWNDKQWRGQTWMVLVIGGCSAGLCPCSGGQRQLGASNNDLLWNHYAGQWGWSQGNGTAATKYMSRGNYISSKTLQRKETCHYSFFTKLMNFVFWHYHVEMGDSSHMTRKFRTLDSLYKY